MTDWKSTAKIATRQAESLQASNDILRAELLSLTQAHAVEVSQLHQEIDDLTRARDEISSGRMDSALMEIAREETTQTVCTERDALAAEVEQLTQERETGAALDSEARAHDEIYVLDLIEQRDMLVVEVKRLRSFMFVFGPKMGTRR